MPSWSSRLPQTANTAPTSSSTSASGTVFRPEPPSTPLAQQDQPPTHYPDQDHVIPTLHPLRRATTHGRSVSHPFPSLFGVGRKVAENNEELVSGMGHNSPRVGDASSIPSKGQLAFEERDFVTGNCATCNSTVRWPRQLDVYRCTVCLMVNDLKPLEKRNPVAEQSPVLYAPHTQRKALTLSCETTRILIDQSIKAYLEQRAKDCLSSLHDHENSNINDGQSFGDTLPKTGKGDASPSTTEVIPGPPTRSPPSPPTRPESRIPHTAIDAQENVKHESKYIFRQLENYLIACLNDCDCLNVTFSLSRPSQPVRASSEASAADEKPRKPDSVEVADNPLFEVDAKTLLLGDIGENGTWWTGGRRPSQKKASQDSTAAAGGDRKALRFDWPSIHQWYTSIISCGMFWKTRRQRLPTEERCILERFEEEQYIEAQLAEARYHVHRTFLKAIENLLRRPGKPMKTPADCRFLLILLLNPLLYPREDRSSSSSEGEWNLLAQNTSQDATHNSHAARPSQSNTRGCATGQHSGIIKRILGLMANLSIECHQEIVSWICRLPEPHFKEAVELVGGFVSYRLVRQSGRTRSSSQGPTTTLVPSMSGPGAGTSAHLHAALSIERRAPNKDNKNKTIIYADDWQIRVAAKVMSLLFTVNNSGKHISYDFTRTAIESSSLSSPVAARQRAHRHSQILPTSAFYNTLIDYADLVSDFETWEARRGKFSFCQYPMFLSIWAKIRIMEHDAHRQMEIKARDAFFTSILSRKAVNQYLMLKVRRDCLVDDSLRSVSEVVGTGQEEIKKGLRIEFVGEEGVDAGGLRKEWFLLLVREVFDPDHGLFVYDTDSHYCYFNPNSFETSDQFFLVGVVLGLAIYNSTILDVALPPFAFRKLLASAPTYNGPSTTATRPSSQYSLDDLAEWQPVLARGLRQLLEHDGDVETTFCRDFVADVERYGQIIQVPLCTNGQDRAVTNSNRREFVELYIRYLLDTSVARQFEPFKRGFFTVCGGNALSLFRPEEIELLVRGSDEPLDIASLRAVAVYENWPSGESSRTQRLDTVASSESPVVKWFWENLEEADSGTQKAILTFITGSDRIPAMGTTSLVIKVVYLTDDRRRYPVARTCFNMIGLHQYRSKDELRSRLWRAVQDSEGFGLK